MRFIILISISCLIFAQDSGVQSVYDFWQDGIWEAESIQYNGKQIKGRETYTVKRILGKQIIEELWDFDEEGFKETARVIRAYDEETKQWRLFYFDGLYAQVWDSKVINGKLYHTKEFNFSGKRILSRQNFHKESNRVIRTIERSVDNGKTWTTRYFIVLKRRDI
ncbi:MAG: hypothetical protein KDD94_09240 [Calditrichaeota bacterium]|nr:hypothetical protein [Calditrichota bacterium]